MYVLQSQTANTRGSFPENSQDSSSCLREKNKQKQSLRCLLGKVNPISLRVGHTAKKTDVRGHAMALIVSYLEPKLSRKESHCLLGKGPGCCANLWLYGGGQAGKDTKAQNMGRLGSGHVRVWWWAWQAWPSPVSWGRMTLAVARDACEQCV